MTKLIDIHFPLDMSLKKPTSALGISSINVDQAEETGGILGVFSKPPVDTLLQKSNLVEILPLNPISRGSPLEFILGKRLKNVFISCCIDCNTTFTRSLA